jgi:hypothetical protein
MAKLHARDRHEIYRLEKWITNDPGRPYDRYKNTKALMSDGTILTKVDSGGWGVSGKIKPGLNAEEALRINLKNGYQIVNLSIRWFSRTGDTIVLQPGMDKPLVTEAKAASRKRAAVKRKEKYKAESERKNGPGFYVTNAYSGGGMRTRVADHEEPFPTYDAAEAHAWDKLRELVGMKFTYLLPVVVIEAESRDDAEGGMFIREGTGPYGRGNVWWINGKFTGPPVDPRQMTLFG